MRQPTLDDLREAGWNVDGAADWRARWQALREWLDAHVDGARCRMVDPRYALAKMAELEQGGEEP